MAEWQLHIGLHKPHGCHICIVLRLSSPFPARVPNMISQLAQQQAVGIRHARALAFGRLSCRQRARVRAVACAKLAWGSPFSNASR